MKKTIAQTPAPKKERIYGSNINKPKSSESTKSASQISFSEDTLSKIKNKLVEHNEKYPSKKINLATAKAVVRRGMGAYSSSHRPTITGGKPNSRVAWGLARLNAFIYKIVNGKSKSGKYNQDDDLIKELGYSVKQYADGGNIEDIRKEYTNILAQKIRDNGYDVSVNYSKTDFGESHYLTVRLKDTSADLYYIDKYYVKIRISDHSVENIYRIRNEVHIQFPIKNKENNLENTINYLLQEIRFKLERDKYFYSEKSQDYNLVNIELNEEKVAKGELRTDDIILSERLSSSKRGAERKIYLVQRKSYYPIIKFIYKPTGKVFTEMRYEEGGEIGGITNYMKQGIVYLKFSETSPKHAKEYGITAKKPLYVQNLFVSEDKRLNGIGKDILQYLEDYAIKNENDVIFGYVSDNAKFSGDTRQSFFSDVDMIKNWLKSSGYAINENNDFHKVVSNSWHYTIGGL